jgi:lysophospholipase L1-like esterase
MHRIAAGMAVATVMLAGGVAGAAPALAASHASRPAVNVSTYYLSLGDSLAQGVQPNAQGTSVETNEGYPNQLYTALSQTNPYLRLVKLGCPGETTTTMINGGICTYPQGSQLAQAVEFLHKHAGRVGLVTIDIGANDLNPCLALTSLPKLVACLEKVIPQTVANLGQIMTELRSADPAPGAIIGMSYYDPELANWLKDTKASRTLATDSITLAEIFNKDLAGVYKKSGAPTADVYGAFRTADLTHMVTTPEFGTIPVDVATLCSYTWECAAPPVGPNEHANILGYGVIANAFFNTYTKLIMAG